MCFLKEFQVSSLKFQADRSYVSFSLANFSLRFLALFLVLLSLSTYSQKLESPKSKANYRIKTYLDPDGSLKGYYELSDSGVFIFSGPTEKAKRNHEFFLNWNDAGKFISLFRSEPDSVLAIYERGRSLPLKRNYIQKNNPPAPYVPEMVSLKGMKIALDPGHMAGDSAMARIEGKCLFLEYDSAGQKQRLELIEGQLTLATAHMVKEALEKAGAEVMMTREKPNQSAFGITYDEWLKKELPESKLGRFKIFHDKFKSLELLERAKKINAFAPDLTLIIHYNVDETNVGWTKPGRKNFTMAFIGGNIISKNLSGKINRIEFLRLLVSDDLEKSEQLAGHLVSNFNTKLNVPVAKPSDAIYLKEESIQTPTPGVYSRNLALTRLVHGPLAYGESLYQDNFSECKDLCNCTIDVKGVKTSERVKKVAECYVQAVFEFVGKKQ